MPSSGLAIRQEPGANALDTANAIRAKMTELSRYFPQGMKVVYPYDTTPFTKVAIEEVVKTLFEAIVLVFLVMYLFMGNMRATLIPTIAVPVVLLGTFAVLGLFGFSINMLTMFAMVLAIGLFSGRRHCRCGERGTDHVRRRAFAPGSHRQVHGTNYTRVDRHRIGALGCLCSHGVFWRFDRCHLPPVFRDRHCLHAPFAAGGLDPHTGPLRLVAQACTQGA